MGTSNTYESISPPQSVKRRRNLAVGHAFRWLSKGWADIWLVPLPSLVYGFAVFCISIVMIWAMFKFEVDYILFPALAGFMVVGPLIAIGLYQKSRDLAQGTRVSLHRMLTYRGESGAQVWFAGAILCLLMLGWMRAAVIIYALFFGLQPFPGLDQLALMLFTTPTGWAMIAIGAVVGGVFASFSFAISVFGIPMLLDERTDAFTAMGTSISLVWNNLPVMMAWGAIVLFLFLISVATAFVGFIVVFPLLGHATWHCYKAIR